MVTKFLDVEAVADDSDESSSSEEFTEGKLQASCTPVAIVQGHSSGDFIADELTTNDTAEERDIASSHPLYPWDELENEAGRLEEIVQDLRNRHQARRHPSVPCPKSDSSLPVRDCHLYPMPKDPDLYRVRVRVCQTIHPLHDVAPTFLSVGWS